MLETRNLQDSRSNSAGRTRARLLKVSGVALLMIAVLGLIALQAIWQQAPFWQSALLFALLVVVVAVGIGSYTRGKRMSAPPADALIASDPRPPVLYLRSFKDDLVTAEPQQTGLGGLLGAITSAATGTEEEQLADAMKEVGPFVAIGRPGEPLPELGAARVYVGDTEWQDRVRQLMSSAQLVVLRGGGTAGLQWEVRNVFANVSPERIVFLLPYDPEQYEVFRQRAEEYTPCRLPPYPPGKIPSAGSIRGILLFEHDWTPHFLVLTGFRQWGITRRWVTVFETTLQPVYEQLRLKARKPNQLFLYSGVGTPPVYKLLVAVSIIVIALALWLPSYYRSHTVEPETAESLLSKGESLGLNHDLEGAIAAYRAAIRLKPDSSAHAMLGFALTEKGDLDGAIAELREDVRLEPNVYYAHDNLGSVLQKKGDLDGAMAEYREAIRLDRLDAKAHTNLGLILYAKGKYREGVLEITEGYRLDPNDPWGLAIYKQYVTHRP